MRSGQLTVQRGTSEQTVASVHITAPASPRSSGVLQDEMPGPAIRRLIARRSGRHNGGGPSYRAFRDGDDKFGRGVLTAARKAVVPTVGIPTATVCVQRASPQFIRLRSSWDEASGVAARFECRVGMGTSRHRPSVSSCRYQRTAATDTDHCRIRRVLGKQLLPVDHFACDKIPASGSSESNTKLGCRPRSAARRADSDMVTAEIVNRSNRCESAFART